MISVIGINIEDIFNRFFGGGFGGGFGFQRIRTGPQPGRNLQTAVEISLEQAASGTEVELSINRLDRCSICGGSGAEPGTNVVTCPKCGGSGQTQRTVSSPFGRMMTVTTCDRCQGRGRTPEKPCSKCRGDGVEQKRKTINIKIPPGIDGLWGPRVRKAYADMGILGFAEGDVEGMGLRDEQVARELDARLDEIRSTAATASASA